MIAVSPNCEYPGGDDLVPLEELIRQTPGANPISTVDELRCDAFQTDDELDDFLAFVTKSRHTNRRLGRPGRGRDLRRDGRAVPGRLPPQLFRSRRPNCHCC